MYIEQPKDRRGRKPADNVKQASLRKRVYRQRGRSEWVPAKKVTWAGMPNWRLPFNSVIKYCDTLHNVVRDSKDWVQIQTPDGTNHSVVRRSDCLAMRIIDNPEFSKKMEQKRK